MKAAVRLGRVGGVELIADVSVLVVAGVLGWLHSIAVGTLETGPLAGILGIAVGFGYLGSLLLHEAAHGQVALRRGLRPRRIRLLVFGGYTAFNDRAFRPADEFWVAMAGPIASFGAGVILLGLSSLFGFNAGVAETLGFLAVLNLVLGAFNVLPGLPLDGGRALHAVMWNSTGDRVRAAQLSTVAGRAVGLGVTGVGLFLLVTRSDLAGLVWIVLGWFLYQSATAAGKREELIAHAGGSTARDVMRASPDAVPGTMRVAEVTSLFQSGPTMRSLPVAVDGRVTGIIGQPEIDDLAPGRRELGRAAAVMKPIGPGDIIDADTPVDALVARIAAKDRFVVVENGVVVGVIESPRLIEALYES